MKYIPTFICQNIFEIDFTSLYAQGKRIILSDLDNTIATYMEKTPSNEVIAWNKKVRDLGFKVYLVSNNYEKRILEYAQNFVVDGYIAKAYKPLKRRMKKYLNYHQIDSREVIAIGDQLVTDIVAYNRLGVDSILVKTINQESQKWYTKINRSREKNILKKIKKVDSKKYYQIKDLYE